MWRRYVKLQTIQDTLYPESIFFANGVRYYTKKVRYASDTVHLYIENLRYTSDNVSYSRVPL